jgi:hypothetical protein
MLSPPDALLADGDLMMRVLAIYQGREERPPEPSVGPDRATLIAAARTAA